MYIMLDIKQIWTIFLLELKTGQKAAETTLKISNTFDPRTGNQHIGQWWFKKFAKYMEDLKMSSWPSKVETTNWELSSKLLLLKLHEKLLS